MTTKNIFDFLKEFSAEELKQRGILRGDSNQLKSQSIHPLFELMKENHVDRLEDTKQDWFLDIEGHFNNPKSAESKKGNYSELSNPGNVFNYANSTINPYYRGYFFKEERVADENTEQEEAEGVLFSLERDLQMALRRNIEQLEVGLRIVDENKERTVEGGRIDITAEDKKKRLVAIELKAGEAKPESIAQILAYMVSLEQEENKEVRGILVAAKFHPRVALAAKAIPNLQLTEYSFTFTFKNH
ncbi:MAG: DUF91 domain-containing protein [Gammaproteobacteria bacterium]|nr:DUF91 domain-containing protein [Gammaproteobacteria bacterium]